MTARHVARVLVLVFAIWPGSAIAQAFSSCGNGPSPITNRPGFVNVLNQTFQYESRAEKFSSYAHKFYWCIRNEGGLPAFIRWGTQATDGKYFDNLVRPQQSPDWMPNWVTDSSGIDSGKRFIKFRRSNRPDVPLEWKEIDRETIFPKESSRLQQHEHFTGLVQLVQDSRFGDYVRDGVIDLAKLSTNRELFRLFIEAEGKVQLTQGSVVTLPTNSFTLNAIEAGKYDKYNPADFVDLRLSLAHVITSDGSTARSEIILMPQADSEEDRIKIGRVAELPILLSISPTADDAPRFPGGLAMAQKISLETKFLLKQPTGILSHLSGVIEVKDQRNGIRLSSAPLQTLMPTRAP